MNNLSFKCQHADEYGCEAVIKYEFYKKHLAEDCIHKLIFPVEKKFEKYQPIDKSKFKDIPPPINLAQLFFEEGDEPFGDEEEPEDVDMGNLFGDDDDY